MLLWGEVLGREAGGGVPAFGVPALSRGGEAESSPRCKIPGSEKLSETRVKKVRMKSGPVTIGKAHSPF